MRYLTNTPLSNEARCIWAAEQSSQDIRFEREPMPYSGTHDDEYYDRERLIGNHGCVVQYDDGDTDSFWLAWDNYSGDST